MGNRIYPLSPMERLGALPLMLIAAKSYATAPSSDVLYVPNHILRLGLVMVWWAIYTAYLNLSSFFFSVFVLVSCCLAFFCHTPVNGTGLDWEFGSGLGGSGMVFSLQVGGVFMVSGLELGLELRGEGKIGSTVCF